MLLRIAAFSCLGGYLYGYDLGLISGALEPIRTDLDASDFSLEIMVGGAKFGAVFGTFLGGALMLHYGRRKAIGLDSLFFVLGPLAMAFSSSMLGLTIGRILVGIGIGVSAVVVPSYLGEIAPANVRGRIVEAYEVMLCIGMLMAMLVDAALQNVAHNWRWMVGAPIIPALFLAMALFILPESPRWLVTRGKLDSALAVIHQVYTKSLLPLGAQQSTAEVEQELLELWSSVEKEQNALRVSKLEAHQRAVAKRASKGWKKAWYKKQRPQNGGNIVDPSSSGGKQSESAAIELSTDRHPRTPSGRPPGAAQEERRALIREDSPRALHGEFADGSSSSVIRAMNPSGQDAPATAFPLGPKEQTGEPSGSPIHVALSNPASPLYRSLSEIPKNLSPVRTKSEDGLDEESSPPIVTRKTSLRRHSSRSSRADESFWITFWEMMKQVGTVARGEERYAFFMALILAFVNQAIASSSIINYAPKMIADTGIHNHTTATLLTSTITAAKMSGVILGVVLIDSLGRRPLLIYGSAACAASLVLLFGGVFMQSTVFEILAMSAFMLSFNASYAGVFWVLLSELFSMTAKSPAASAATAMMFLAGSLADSLFLSLLRWLGPYSFLVYASIAFFGGVFCFYHVPETKRCTLSEVQAKLRGKSTGLPETVLQTTEIPVQDQEATDVDKSATPKDRRGQDRLHLLAGQPLSDGQRP